MAIQFQHRRSGTASKRPESTILLDGELAVNTNASSAGVFLKDSAGAVRKVGPAEVSLTAPNSSAAGSAGNSVGEFWYDTSTSVLKIFDGNDFVAAGGGLTLGSTFIPAGGTSLTLDDMVYVASEEVQYLNNTNGSVVLRGADGADGARVVHYLPSSQGTSGQVLTTNGSGNWLWETISTNSITDGDSNVTVDGSSNEITLSTDGTEHWTVNADGDLLASHTLQDIGSAAMPIDNIYVNKLNLGTPLTPEEGGTGVDTSAAANGQILVGTGSGLALTSLTANTGIEIIEGSGTLEVRGLTSTFNRFGMVKVKPSGSHLRYTGAGELALGFEVPVNLRADDGNDATASSHQLNIVGGDGLATTASGNELTISLTDLPGGSANAGSYGSADRAVSLTVDAAGRVTDVADQLISITSSQVSDFHPAVQTNRLDEMATPTADVNFGGVRITDLADPTQPQDAATKAYVDAVSQGLVVHDPVKVASKNLSGYSVTSSGANDLAAGVNGILQIDGVPLVAADRFLYAVGSADSGVYEVVDAGSSATTWSATRVDDLKVNTDLPGAFFFVELGNEFSQSGFVCRSDSATVIGTDDIEFAQFSGTGLVEAGNGLTKSGRVINARGTAYRIDVTADAIDISANYEGQSSIDTVGTITSGEWNGTEIGLEFGGTGTDNTNVDESEVFMGPASGSGPAAFREIQCADIAPITGGSFDGGQF